MMEDVPEIHSRERAFRKIISYFLAIFMPFLRAARAIKDTSGFYLSLFGFMWIYNEERFFGSVSKGNGPMLFT